ncbi:YtxH domain-containing protein [Azohydromonas lata]|uniref:YtxH domain-containing protein n=1 Tax=Azohydromonas lata TaxID=45677 RepID=A0ABU5IEJ2_9BURK|nr:YtxH domain-containing protein [Azohydromonas lata]MDZ5456935.1 YtxH domain-containing protein [Azohydromonas lata]
MKNAWTALGALAAGAAAMYLTDPEQGARRRADLRQRFATATDDALDNLQSAGDQATDRLQGAAQDGRGLLRDILTRVQDLAEQGRLNSRQALNRVDDIARDARNESSNRWHEGYVPESRRSGGGGGLLLAVSGIVVGAAAIYLLKTESGRQRLAGVREQARQLKDQLGQQLTERKEQISQQLSQRKEQLAQRFGKHEDSATAGSEADDAAYSAPASRESTTTPALANGNRPATGSSSELQGGGGWH